MIFIVTGICKLAGSSSSIDLGPSLIARSCIAGSGLCLAQYLLTLIQPHAIYLSSGTETIAAAAVLAATLLVLN